MSPILHEQDDIVRDSIIKNKDKTKTYWEQLMTAAAENNKSLNSKAPVNGAVVSRSNSNSVSSEDGSVIEDELLNVKEEKRRIEREIRLQNLEKEVSVRMEEKIAQELQEMQQREEELRILRQQSLSSVKTEEVISQDGSNYSEYGSEEKEPSLDGSTRDISAVNESLLRTQSLDSVSSGHSSGSGLGFGSGSSGAEIVRDVGPKKRTEISVRPFEEPEETSVTDFFSRTQKESPIEREIRLSNEREAELKRLKGITDNPSKATVRKIQLGRSKDAIENDPRDVQKRLATNRIQQEIEEASERENELRMEGKIKTTSQETVDAKVTRFTQLAEHAIEEQKNLGRRIKRSTSTSFLTEEENLTPVAQPRKASFERSLSSTSKGLMERFFLSAKSKIGKEEKPVVVKRKPIEFETPPPPPVFTTPPTRNGYRSAEEKIRSELEEMQKREEELKLQRAHLFTASQPNLSVIATGEDELDSWKSHEEHDEKETSSLSHAVSNPNLLDFGIEKMRRRKRFSLLEQWENRIQNAES